MARINGLFISVLTSFLNVLQKVEERMTKSAILQMTGLPSDTSREDLKEVFLKHGTTVAWVDLTKGDTEVGTHTKKYQIKWTFDTMWSS